MSGIALSFSDGQCDCSMPDSVCTDLFQSQNHHSSASRPGKVPRWMHDGAFFLASSHAQPCCRVVSCRELISVASIASFIGTQLFHEHLLAGLHYVRAAHSMLAARIHAIALVAADD